MKLVQTMRVAAFAGQRPVVWLLWLSVAAVLTMMLSVRYLGASTDHALVGNGLGLVLFVLVYFLIRSREGTRSR